MAPQIMLLVLLAAFLHAGWNGMVRASPDKEGDIVLVTTAAAVIAAIILPFVAPPALESWRFIAASAVIHVAYFTLVGAVYHRGEMSYAYPLMRGLPPLLVALASGILIGESPGRGGWAGILVICGGILALTGGQAKSSATGLALLNALVIAGYTLIDGIGVRHSGQPLSYTLWVFLSGAPPIFLMAWQRRPGLLAAHFRSRWRIGLLGGGCTVAAYVVVLFAMTRAPVALVAALRETAIPIGTALSALILKERVGWRRPAASLAIMLGAVLLRLA